MYSANIWIVLVYSCTLIIQNIVVSSFNITSDVIYCNNTSLYQISVKNQTHTLWYLISASQHHPPSLILIHTTGESKVNVDCSKFDDNNTLNYRHSVSVNNSIQSYGLILHRIIRYRDINDETIAPDTGSQTETFLGSNLNWKNSSFKNDSNNDQISIEFEATQSLDSHEKINGVIKLNFKVYKTAEPRHKEMYYRIENALSIFIELILDKVEVINSNDNFSPVLLIFSNHSLMDDSYYWNKTTIQKYCEDGPLGKIKSPFIQLGLEVSKDNKLIQSTWPNAYLQFPAAYWIDRENTQAQLVRLGIARPIDHRYVKPKSYHFSLPFAFYGDRFNQIHSQSTENQVAVRELIINLGSPHSKHYYADTNYSSWIVIAGLGDPDIVPPNDDDDDDDKNNSNKNSIISAFICGLLIIIGAISSVSVIRRIQRRHYQRISELNSSRNNNNNSNNNEAISSHSRIMVQELSSINDNRIVEPYQYEKLISQPNHELIRNNYHTITNEDNYLPNNNISNVNWVNAPPPYGSITKDY
ncbi:uncharacterized protein DC041_0011900 [Schistosoma bovis]|uniref:Lysosomal protein NCU-G1 n=1 Tax=Schistosoma bovis TaxID=6184 RepID=A0A430QC77_SCHBO|nr:uncharacterized protein DC041_0011900 [Schistosoma bovis]CAH8594890.1 unnamed protein product [Schistosoma bovis]CAH8606241.1 unnamed protein product [Schistosoma haematobium]